MGRTRGAETLALRQARDEGLGEIVSILLLSGHPFDVAGIAWTLGSSPREKEEGGPFFVPTSSSFPRRRESSAPRRRRERGLLRAGLPALDPRRRGDDDGGGAGIGSRPLELRAPQNPRQAQSPTVLKYGSMRRCMARLNSKIMRHTPSHATGIFGVACALGCAGVHPRFLSEVHLPTGAGWSRHSFGLP